MLEIKQGKFGYCQKGKEKVLMDGLSATFEKGELWCLLGANGTGKTTLYRTVLGFLPLLDGDVCLEGKSLLQMGQRERAKRIAYVPQYHTPPFPYTVEDVVLMGRAPHLSHFATPSTLDVQIAQEMMERMGILHLREEVYTEISGGERQLVLIARALTQQSEYILMDEPTSNLDYGNQLRLLREIKRLAKEGVGICFTTHNPDHAFLTDANVLAIEGRQMWRSGKAQDVITEDFLNRVYGFPVEIVSYKDATHRTRCQIRASLEEV
jgi:iron complex transport system ATP-binding protein